MAKGQTKVQLNVNEAKKGERALYKSMYRDYKFVVVFPVCG
jgi:hypothetical protein